MIDEKTFTKFLNRTDIEGIVQSLGNQLTRDYEGKQVVSSACSRAAACSWSTSAAAQARRRDRLRAPHPQGRGLTTPGTVAILKDPWTDIRGKHVITVEEIIDWAERPSSSTTASRGEPA